LKQRAGGGVQIIGRRGGESGGDEKKKKRTRGGEWSVKKMRRVQRRGRVGKGRWAGHKGRGKKHHEVGEGGCRVKDAKGSVYKRDQ